jgi:hypothetical protein
MNLIRYSDSDYLCIFKLFLFHSDGGHKKNPQQAHISKKEQHKTRTVWKYQRSNQNL